MRLDGVCRFDTSCAAPSPSVPRLPPSAARGQTARPVMAPPAAPAGAPPGGAGKGGDAGTALACATLAQLRPGAVRYDLSVPAQLLHPASALQLYGALPGASATKLRCMRPRMDLWGATSDARVPCSAPSAGLAASQRSIGALRMRRRLTRARGRRPAPRASLYRRGGEAPGCRRSGGVAGGAHAGHRGVAAGVQTATAVLQEAGAMPPARSRRLCRQLTPRLHRARSTTRCWARRTSSPPAARGCLRSRRVPRSRRWSEHGRPWSHARVGRCRTIRRSAHSSCAIPVQA